MIYKTFNYKLEIRLEGDSLEKTTDLFWKSFFRGVAERGFTGVVFYAEKYHPFELILDFRTFPHAVDTPEAVRNRQRNAFNRMLAHAHAQGLKTFLQHYVWHFPQALAVHAGLHLREGGVRKGARLAGYDLPVIIDYCAYCYREVFQQCPDLDGLYFNFESSRSACDHILKTAVAECNRMDKRPIFVFRLWGMRDPSGMRQIAEAYQGRVIVDHKIADTADVYHLPVADSRVWEWKQAIPGIEFMHQAGPCHNSAASLCEMVWGDYDYVQTLLASSRERGADSIGFHAMFDILSPRLEPFDPAKTSFSIYNIMHLEAAVDFAHGRQRTVADREALMAEWLEVSPAAGRAAYQAITASSKMLPLAECQHLICTCLEGYWMPPRVSLVQHPFLYMPASQLSSQRDLPKYIKSWIYKERDQPVGRPNETQYIIDYVNPAKPRALLPPPKIADQIEAAATESLQWARKYRRLAGAGKGNHLMRFMRTNHAVGMYACHSIRAGIAFYAGYFAQTKAAIVKGFERGIAELELARRLERNKEHHSQIIRSYYYFCSDALELTLAAARRTLALIKRTRLPLNAFRAFLASRHEYNEIMRYVRAEYEHGQREYAYAGSQIDRARREADRCLSLLKPGRDEQFLKPVQAWIQFLEHEKAMLTPPTLSVGASKADAHWIEMTHEQCFRWGEYFSDDFAEFIQPGDYHQSDDHLSFRLAYDQNGLIVDFCEKKTDMEARFAHWEKWRGNIEDQDVMSIFVAPDLDALAARNPGSWFAFNITPRGEKVFLTPDGGHIRPIQLETSFTHTQDFWITTVYIPFTILGAQPKQNAEWGFNVKSNAAIIPNRWNSWARFHENAAPSPFVLGRVKFME